MHLSKKYGLTINEIQKDGFKIYSTIKIFPKNDSLFSSSVSLGREIIQFSQIFNRVKPDLNLILGDRGEMFASAIAASQMNIPNIHIHGGDMSGGIDEYNRHAITKLSNIHFAATKKSQERIIKMGENPKNVFFTGSPSIDEITQNKITDKKTLEQKYGIKFNGDEILLLQHPVTTQTEQSEKQILQILNTIVKIKKMTIVIFPNSDPGNKIIFKHLNSFAKKYPFIRVYPSIPRNDYLGMLKNCGVLVGNSSSGLIESTYLKTPVVNIGIRQEGREKGKNVLDVHGNSIRSIHDAIIKALHMTKPPNKTTDFIYGKGTASKKIVKILEKINLNKDLIQKQLQY
jgi:UDP-N-acetylglucosamine 2-epimerase (non-hydrolysing)/GDP/UDP-N,N'-diacetylbacillosamine 2-epimerase (hydrolysing)